MEPTGDHFNRQCACWYEFFLAGRIAHEQPQPDFPVEPPGHVDARVVADDVLAQCLGVGARNASSSNGKTSSWSEKSSRVTNSCCVLKNDGPPERMKSSPPDAGIAQPTVMCCPNSRRLASAISPVVVRGLLNWRGAARGQSPYRPRSGRTPRARLLHTDRAKHGPWLRSRRSPTGESCVQR